ncbi:MAG: Gfo/Idh/MocA family oxidoreductase [Gemmataceae bacterium]|nr:Gfo/Idh/MocA family oxidoreductase [Gemmataceae bacterium]MDW8265457.1 Gfo/Idh/MocA family oxidoreductase [Gemmataceae bacterium]
MPEKYKVAVIGRTGKGNYGHGLDVVWLTVENVEVVAVADEDPKGRAAAAARLKAPNAYADYRHMLEKERPHIVSVAPRFPDCHRDMVLACAHFGAHVFLEKPMARTLAEADEMVAACERHHVKLAIAHQTRYSPRVKVIRDLLGDGRLGDILEVRGRGKEDQRGGGEDLMVLGTHIFDLMRFLVGDPHWCHARVWKDGRPAVKADIRQGGENMGPVLGDWITATYGFAGGILGSFGTHRARAGVGSRFGLQIFGSKGIIHLTTGSLPAAYLLEDPAWFSGRTTSTWQEITSAGVGKPEPLRGDPLGLGNTWIVRDLIEAIEKDRQPLGSMYDGRAALEMILAVYESYRQSKPVELPLKTRQHPLTLM